jgi:hypothetical protein
VEQQQGVFSAQRTTTDMAARSYLPMKKTAYGSLLSVRKTHPTMLHQPTTSVVHMTCGVPLFRAHGPTGIRANGLTAVFFACKSKGLYIREQVLKTMALSPIPSRDDGDGC